jgi:hypothetical protein
MELLVTGALARMRIRVSATIQAARCGGRSHCLSSTSTVKVPLDAYSK